MDSAPIWVLLYSRKGDNNQALALANSLGQPYLNKTLKYNWLRRIGLHLGATFSTLDRASRNEMRAPWPELVISIGRWSVPVVRAIKAASGGRTRIVFLGNPRVDPAHFDLIFATRDYLQPRGPNVFVIPTPMASSLSDRTERNDWAADLPAPRTLLLIGASIKYWELTERKVAETVSALADRANSAGGSLLVSGSPRTSDKLLLAAENALTRARHGWLANSRNGGLSAMFSAADEIVVTGDSMSMVTEALLTGKPVGLLPLDLSRKGMSKLGPKFAEESSGSRRRDMRRFWAELWNKGLVGTANHPKTASTVNSTAAAALAVASLLSVPQVPFVAGEPPPSSAQTTISVALRSVVSLWSGLETLVGNAQRDAGALWLATWEPQTPWYVKMIAGISSISAMSPVDLTPDVIPIIGFMDDLLLLTIGTILAARLIPAPLLAELRERAVSVEFVHARRGALAIFGIWFAAAGAAILRAFA